MSTAGVTHPLVERLAEIRRRDGLTIRGVATRLDMDPGNCSRMFAGHFQPSARVIGAIAREWPELRDACEDAVFGRSSAEEA